MYHQRSVRFVFSIIRSLPVIHYPRCRASTMRNMRPRLNRTTSRSFRPCEEQWGPVLVNAGVLGGLGRDDKAPSCDRDSSEHRGELSSWWQDEEGSTRLSCIATSSTRAYGRSSGNLYCLRLFVNRRAAYRFYLPPCARGDRYGGILQEGCSQLQGTERVHTSSPGVYLTRGCIIPRICGESGRNNGQDNGRE